MSDFALLTESDRDKFVLALKGAEQSGFYMMMETYRIFEHMGKVNYSVMFIKTAKRIKSKEIKKHGRRAKK